MKVHATRVPAPTVTQEHGTKWQVAVTMPDGTIETFDRVSIDGPAAAVCLPEEAPVSMQPRVWVEPLAGTRVTGLTLNEYGALMVARTVYA